MTISPLQEPSLTEIFVSDSVSKLLFLGSCGCSNHGRWFVLDQHAKCSHYLLLIWFMLAAILDFAMLSRMAMYHFKKIVCKLGRGFISALGHTCTLWKLQKRHAI
jgi:hypothetical protein